MSLSENRVAPLGTPVSGGENRLAWGSLGVGVVAVLFSPLWIGGLLGVVGVSLGLAAQREASTRLARAQWGVGLSVVAIGIAAALLMFRMAGTGGAAGGRLAEWEGVAAPEITFVTLQGQRVTLSDLRGKRVVLNFWATWCGPCRREIPDLIEVAATAGEEVVIFGISDEPPEVLRPFVDKLAINYAVVSADSWEWPSPYKDLRYIPTNFIVDREGVIQAIRGPVSAKTLYQLLESPGSAAPPKPAPSG